MRIALASMGATATLAYALAGGTSALTTVALFVPVNMSFGLRGPPGFYRALLASHGDHARGSAVVILATMVAAAGGTAAVAPFIEEGLVPLALAALALQLQHWPACSCCRGFKKEPDQCLLWVTCRPDTAAAGMFVLPRCRRNELRSITQTVCG